eukprot:GHVS01053500.1.p1 GENE.GHVS01053500.1~~GHVS01053500.1.p1  ORF type:complete len:436 (-),score=101.29 GHVS01053500.1:492-1799(-)
MSLSVLLLLVVAVPLSSTLSFQFHPSFLCPQTLLPPHLSRITRPFTSRVHPLQPPPPSSQLGVLPTHGSSDASGSSTHRGQSSSSGFSTSPPPSSPTVPPSAPCSQSSSSLAALPSSAPPIHLHRFSSHAYPLSSHIPPPQQKTPTTHSSEDQTIPSHSSSFYSSSKLTSDSSSPPLPSSHDQRTTINTPPPPSMYPSLQQPPTLLDWREFRARLAESGGQATFESRMDEGRRLLFGLPYSPDPVWAHTLPSVEPGCVLVSSRDSPPSRQSVIFVVHVDSQAASGTSAAHPPSTSAAVSGLLLGELCSSAGRASPRVPRELAASPLFFGGTHGDMRVYVLHNKPQLKESKELISGVSVGCSISDAAEMVQNGVASPMDFRFYLQYVTWSAAELSSALSSGQWQPMACSPSLLLHPVSSVSRQHLWYILHALTSTS